MDWQPIETAKANRKVIAGYRNTLGNWRTVTACYHTQLPWHDEHDWSDDDGDYAPEGWYEESETYECIRLLEHTPTHWMPLPAPPEPTEEELLAGICTLTDTESDHA